MEITLEYNTRSTVAFQQRCASQCYLDRIRVGIEKVCQEATTGLIASVGFVHNEYALQVGGICRETDFFLVFGKALDIHNRNLWLTACSLLRMVVAELRHQFSTCVGC